MQKYKVVVIGSGIAGMTAAIYLKRGGIEPLIIENNAPGGTLNVIPNIENYPGYRKISGPDLAMNIYNQVSSLCIDYIFKNFKDIDFDKRLIDGEIEYDYLIIATGRKNKLLGIDGEDRLLGRGVSTCALCDGTFYKDKNVVIVGGASSALTESLYLASICKKVTIIHRRNIFSGESYLIDKVLNTPNIEIIFNRNVTSYNTDGEKLVSVSLDNGDILKTDGVFLAIGSIPNSEMFDVEKDNGYIVVSDKYETSVENVFAIGDVIKKDYYQLINASSEGMMVASYIIEREKNK